MEKENARCELFKKTKSKLPIGIMLLAVNQTRIPKEFTATDIMDEAINPADSRVYFWLEQLCEKGFLVKTKSGARKAKFKITEEGKQCYECYFRAHSHHYANALIEEEYVPASCILKS